MRISDWSSDVCSSDLQARNLASLPSSVVNQLRANLATTERLIAQARGLAYDVTNLDREFARLYPEQYAATVSGDQMRSEEHTSELQSLMRISYAVFCLKKKKTTHHTTNTHHIQHTRTIHKHTHTPSHT